LEGVRWIGETERGRSEGRNECRLRQEAGHAPLSSKLGSIGDDAELDIKISGAECHEP